MGEEGGGGGVENVYGAKVAILDTTTREIMATENIVIFTVLVRQAIFSPGKCCKGWDRTLQHSWDDDGGVLLSCRQYGQHWVPHTGYGHLHGLADPAAARALRCHQPPAGPSLRPGRRNLPAPHTHRRSVSLFSHAPCTPTVGQSACFPMHPAHPP